MIVARYAFALLLCAAVAGCSGGNKGASSSSANSAESSPAAAASVAAAQGGGGDNSSLPVYPGATLAKTQVKGSQPYCGHKVTMTMYRVPSDNAGAVAQWYESHVSGGVNAEKDVTNNDGSGAKTFMVFAPNGADAAIIMQMHFSGATATAAHMSSADKTNIVLAKYDPAFSSDDLNLIRQAVSASGPQAKALEAQFKAKCRQDAP